MCQKSTAHEQRRSRGESRKLRFGSNCTAPKICQDEQHDLHSPPQPIDRREHTNWSSPRSILAYKKPTSTRKLRKFPVTSGQGSKHRDWTASRWWARSRLTIAVIVVSASGHQLTRAYSGWSRTSWFSCVTLPWLRGGTSVAPWRHKCSHVPVFRRLFDRLPVRISTSDLHHRILRKKLYHIRAYDFGVQFSFNWSCHSTLVCPVADQLKVAGEAACTYSRRSRGGRDTLAAVVCTSWPARRCPGIRAPRWSWSLRSPSSAELSRLPITPSRGEHTPLWRKLLFDRWTCIIQLSLLEKWLGSLNIFVFITDKKKRARKKELLLKLQHNIAASLPPWLNPTLSLRDR